MPHKIDEGEKEPAAMYRLPLLLILLMSTVIAACNINNPATDIPIPIPSSTLSQSIQFERDRLATEQAVLDARILATDNAATATQAVYDAATHGARVTADAWTATAIQRTAQHEGDLATEASTNKTANYHRCH